MRLHCGFRCFQRAGHHAGARAVSPRLSSDDASKPAAVHHLVRARRRLWEASRYPHASPLTQNTTEALKELKFGIGDGHLQFYLYNWRVPKVRSSPTFTCADFIL